MPQEVHEPVQSSAGIGYTRTMETTWIKNPGHSYSYKSSCSTKFIDRDSRGWKLYTQALGRWTYFSTLEAAQAVT